MDNLGITLVIGISSSLVATLIFILSGELIRKVLIPWYADKIYRGVRIDGNWACTQIKGSKFPQNDKTSIGLQLEQKGELISGTYTHKYEEHIDHYIVEGRIRDMCFLATAVPKSNRHVDAMSFLFRISNEKSRLMLTGNILHMDHDGEILSTDVQLAWKNSKT